ncbi:hypothetical protein BC936DRAFT_144949 [Jimgerdemannia flammicorona]|uniref:Uncharacterized protein n=1 Tax=Jimgerdemannia flammicorona TaxID=994334 RepID=A0A433DBA4_9FUNG|nr:hypothetical protein BC936DRAFT_144949 [Jimgerdemannia flammicorona]
MQTAFQRFWNQVTNNPSKKSLGKRNRDGDTIVRVRSSGSRRCRRIEKATIYLAPEISRCRNRSRSRNRRRPLGGTHLGRDPRDVLSTLENSLVFILHQAGFALPNLPGPSGGSLQHSLAQDVTGIRIIDDKGDIHDISITDTDNSRFFAAGISLGLLACITKVTLKLVVAHNISGISDN